MLDEIRDDETSRGESETGRPRHSVRPDVDIFSAEESFIIVADVPGLTKKDLNVTVEADDLIIDGPIAGREGRESDLAWAYHRRFRLRSHIDRENIGAKLEGGVLRVTLPKAAPEPGRKVKVS